MIPLFSRCYYYYNYDTNCNYYYNNNIIVFVVRGLPLCERGIRKCFDRRFAVFVKWVRVGDWSWYGQVVVVVVIFVVIFVNWVRVGYWSTYWQIVVVVIIFIVDVFVVAVFVVVFDVLCISISKFVICFCN